MIKMQRLESLGVLAGGLAHDFNNYLNVIQLQTSILDSEIENNSLINERISLIYQTIDKAQKLTRQLLTFAKGEEPIKKLVFTKDLINNTIEFSLKGSNIKKEYEIVRDLWNIEASEEQIFQTLNNIVINAKQAMPDGGKLTVTAENILISEDRFFDLKEGRYIKIMINDTGPGINDEDIKKIFDPYFTTKDKGNGLGLATAYSIVKKHQGRILVQSQVDEGSCFTIILPASEIVIDEPEQVKPCRVLLLEDDPIQNLALKKLLNLKGFAVQGVLEGEKAIKLYGQHKEDKNFFDVVILDLINNEGLGGKEVLLKLKEIDPDVKAIAISGYSDDPIITNYNEYGFVDAISKPFTIAKILKAFSKIDKFPSQNIETS